jgi:hypothetical protein
VLNIANPSSPSEMTNGVSQFDKDCAIFDACLTGHLILLRLPVCLICLIIMVMICVTIISFACYSVYFELLLKFLNFSLEFLRVCRYFFVQRIICCELMTGMFDCTGSVGVEGVTSLSLEQEKYFSAIVSSTPMGRLIICWIDQLLCVNYAGVTTT